MAKKTKNVKNTKKGDMSLEYIFKIFVATIVVLVVISLVTKWGTKSGGFIDNLFGNKEAEGSANEFISVSTFNCSKTKDEVIKFSRLCGEKGRLNVLKENYCYLISGINQSCALDFTELPAENYTIDYAGAASVSIVYNPDLEKVELK